MVHWVFLAGRVVEVHRPGDGDGNELEENGYLNVLVRVPGGGEAIVSAVVPEMRWWRVAGRIRRGDVVLVKGELAPDTYPFVPQGSLIDAGKGRLRIRYVLIAHDVSRLAAGKTTGGDRSGRRSENTS